VDGNLLSEDGRHVGQVASVHVLSALEDIDCGLGLDAIVVEVVEIEHVICVVASQKGHDVDLARLPGEAGGVFQVPVGILHSVQLLVYVYQRLF